MLSIVFSATFLLFGVDVAFVLKQNRSTCKIATSGKGCFALPLVVLLNLVTNPEESSSFVPTRAHLQAGICSGIQRSSGAKCRSILQNGLHRETKSPLPSSAKSHFHRTALSCDGWCGVASRMENKDELQMIFLLP